MSRTETDSIGPIEVPNDAYWGAQTQRAARPFAAVGEGLGQKPVEGLAGLGAALQLAGLADQVGVRHLLEARLERVDLGDQRADGFHLAIVGSAKDRLCQITDAEHNVLSD